MDTASVEKGNGTITRILEAAASVFSEVGFSGARVDEIAERAGVNKAMIYYHIGNKDALYAEVIQNVIGNTAETIARKIKDVQDPEEKLRIYIRSFARNLDENPQVAPIMMREVASGGRHLPEVVARDIFRIVNMLREIISEGVEKGIFVETIPFLIHIMVIGAMITFKTSAPIRARYDWIPKTIRSMHDKVSGNIAGEIERLILKAVKK
ncbi:MAG TPA: TetR/AcrR family transcriptional regulator [Syntrophales bacterium]|nr:TetR/AcrR family transcriptional regulator [Syntrophales bacterium]